MLIIALDYSYIIINFHMQSCQSYGYIIGKGFIRL